MNRQWVTTRFGDRVDAAQALMVRHQVAGAHNSGSGDRHLLELMWEDGSDLLAVFPVSADCQRALQAFVRQGWVPVLPEVGVAEG